MSVRSRQRPLSLLLIRDQTHLLLVTEQVNPALRAIYRQQVKRIRGRDVALVEEDFARRFVDQQDRRSLRRHLHHHQRQG